MGDVGQNNSFFVVELYRATGTHAGGYPEPLIAIESSFLRDVVLRYGWQSLDTWGGLSILDTPWDI